MSRRSRKANKDSDKKKEKKEKKERTFLWSESEFVLAYVSPLVSWFLVFKAFV